MSISHGTILGGLSVVPNLKQGIEAYRDTLQLDLVEQGELSAELAQSWGCRESAGRRIAILRPASGAPCWFRLVEQPDHFHFHPTTTYGWSAYELTVEDVFGWPSRLAGSPFQIVGEPRPLPGMDAFIPMQALGPGREMIYLNQVFENMEGIELPRARSITDRIFICVLATPDRAATCEWYATALGLEQGMSATLPYAMINNAFGLPEDFMSTLTMIQSGAMPIVEVDDYPAEAKPRPRHAAMLPPGNALVTLAVRSLDECSCEWIDLPAVRQGALYEGSRAAATMGPAGEILELVEIR